MSDGWVRLVSGISPEDTTSIQAMFAVLNKRLGVDDRYRPEVSTISTEGVQGSLANTNRFMSYHTDNVYLRDPCEKVVLFCKQQADSGGENLLIDGLKVIRNLPDDLRLGLCEAVWQWVNPATHAPSDMLSVYDERRNHVRWWRMSLINNMIGSIAVANLFEKALNTSPGSKEVLLEPGDILAIDNSRILHSRKAFTGRRQICRARFW